MSRIQNCTVNAAELQAGIAQQRELSAAGIVEFASHMRKAKPGSVRKIQHSEKDETYVDGEVVTKTVSKTTTRRNH